MVVVVQVVTGPRPTSPPSHVAVVAAGGAVAVRLSVVVVLQLSAVEVVLLVAVVVLQVSVVEVVL